MQKLFNKEHRKRKEALLIKKPFVTNKLCLVGPIVEQIILYIVILLLKLFWSVQTKLPEVDLDYV